MRPLCVLAFACFLSCARALLCVRQARASEWLHIVNDAQPKVLVVQRMEQWEQLQAAAVEAGVRLPRMRVVLVGDAAPLGEGEGEDGGEGSGGRTAAAAGDSVLPAPVSSDPLLTWPQLLAAADDPRARVPRLGASRAHSICTLVYTSGTTGLPKGVALTNWNILHNLLAGWQIGSVRAGERTASFLPWSHAFGATFDLHFMLGHGAHINLVSQVSQLASEAQAIRPHVLLAVPRIWAALYDKVCAAMLASPVKRALFRSAQKHASTRLKLCGFDSYAAKPDTLADKVCLEAARARDSPLQRLDLSPCPPAPLRPRLTTAFSALGAGV